MPCPPLLPNLPLVARKTQRGQSQNVLFPACIGSRKAHEQTNRQEKSNQTPEKKKTANNRNATDMQTENHQVSSTNRNPRPVGEHARRDVHGRQLLEQQLGRVGNVHLRDARLVLAGPALEGLLAQVAVSQSLVSSELLSDRSRSQLTQWAS